jgi:hypothetical protein
LLREREERGDDEERDEGGCALNSFSSCPAWKMRLAINPASMTPWARRIGVKASVLRTRKPRPPVLSGCVGTRRRFRRETCHRNRSHRKPRRYQRKRMKWKIGTLTKTYQYPAAVRRIPVPSGSAYQLVVPIAIWFRQTQRPTV